MLRKIMIALSGVAVLGVAFAADTKAAKQRLAVFLLSRQALDVTFWQSRANRQP